MEGESRVELIQELLDTGMSRNKVAETLGIHHKSVIRLVVKYNLEIYSAFDETEDVRHLYQNFEWLWEEDWLEDFTSKAFDSHAILFRSQCADTVAVGRHVRDNYGNFLNYFKEKKMTVLIDHVSVECPYCLKQAPLRGWYKDERRPWGLIRECPTCRSAFSARYVKNNPDKIFASAQRRRLMAELLPNTFTKEDWVKLRKFFDWRCAITKSNKSISMDHFIPVITGHGGTYQGNLIPLNKSINSSKKDSNPIVWAAERDYNLDVVIRFLSCLNCLTENEYVDYVNWCHENKRTQNEVSEDKRYSLEIWREASGKQLPLPKYATKEVI